jgi:hypothetical protein
MIFAVKGGSLRLGEGAVFHILMDALVLILQTVIHLRAPRMIFLPGRFRRCGAGKAGQRNQHGGVAKMLSIYTEHGFLLS